MAVMMPREKWTDERLDDLNGRVDAGFAHVDKRFDKLEARFDKLMFALLGVGGSIVVALIGLLGVALL
jgi:hypothetical protein